MLNDPNAPKRKLHPLEERPQRPDEPGEDRPPRRRLSFQTPLVRPVVTYVLLAINIGVFILGALWPRLEIQFFAQGANRPFDVLVSGEYHRLVTAMFLHGGLTHIFFNAYALYIIGSSLESLFGHARFTVIYLLGGLMGSVLSVILGDISANVGSVGASGAVFALFGAEMVYLYRHRHLLGEYGKAQLRNLLFLLGVNFLIGIASSFQGAAIRIDNWGHLGGLLGGLALTWLVGPVLQVKTNLTQPELMTAEDTNPLDRRYWAVSLYLIVMVIILAVFSLLARAG